MLEVGWLVDPARQGEGIATEAGAAVLHWCFGVLGIREACSIIRADNLASARVASKLGARIDRVLPEFLGAPADLWLHDPRCLPK